MSISFNEVPGNIRIPFLAVEIDNSQAQQGSSILPLKGLIIGQKLAGGSAVANTLYKISSREDVIGLAGRGSNLDRMATKWFLNNRFSETWLLPLSDDGAGVQATGTITVTGPATASGTIFLYMGGVRLTVAVVSGDSSNTIATSINAAINAATDLPVTSSVATNVVTVTFRHKGLIGNSYDMRANYDPTSEKYPAGVSTAFVQLAGGTTAPSLAAAIANLGDRWFNVWPHPYTDATSLSAIEAELRSRFGPMRMLDGHAITSASGSFATLSALGSGRNSPHSTIVAQAGKSPIIPSWEYAAAVAARATFYLTQDPARPLQTVGLEGVLLPAESDLWLNSERNLLLYDGIATTKDAAGGIAQIERLITTYQTNAAGSEDTAYLDLNTMGTLAYLRYDFRSFIAQQCPRHKLGNDGTRYGAGQAIITPSIGKALACAWFQDKEEQGLVENFAQFKRDVICARSKTDPNRLEWLLPPDLINQFIVGAAKVAFRL